MSKLRRWHPYEVDYYGETIRLELKALNRQEAPAFAGKVGQLVTKARKSDDAFLEDPEVFEQEWIAQAFERYVKLAEPLELEDGEEPIKTGAAFFNEAPFPVVWIVLMRLQALCLNTSDEKKGSRSASISDSDEAPDSSS